MALIFSSQINHKNGLVPLTNKLEESNFSTWQKSVILTLRTLKLQDHFSAEKIPPQFEEVPSTEDESDASSKKGEAASDKSDVTKKTPVSTPKILQESEKYAEWMQIDCALMTWLDASMSITYQNRVVYCATFAEAWETITHIFTASSNPQYPETMHSHSNLRSFGHQLHSLIKGIIGRLKRRLIGD
ncbi:hypothetical protein PIB30_024646 [Stylosanthes scabra]|uniref:Retrotransposon Copia-like N-terminal domain-containing protein n=1 Tax=Stylosanthes scabra TaxID=79078 RepID=A0ABU6XA19_9FABA|nr:hypothetical protein [Stylosanthes scabra]